MTRAERMAALVAPFATDRDVARPRRGARRPWSVDARAGSRHARQDARVAIDEMTDGLPVADPWFVAERVGEGVTLISEPHVHPLLRCNVWHVRGRDQD